MCRLSHLTWLAKKNSLHRKTTQRQGRLSASRQRCNAGGRGRLHLQRGRLWQCDSYWPLCKLRAARPKNPSQKYNLTHVSLLINLTQRTLWFPTAISSWWRVRGWKNTIRRADWSVLRTRHPTRRSAALFCTDHCHRWISAGNRQLQAKYHINWPHRFSQNFNQCC